jgi:hypothetical protein
MSRVLLTSTQVAQRAGLSVHKFLANKKLYDPNTFQKSILNYRARASRKKENTWRAYWYLNDTYWGFNKKSIHGNTVKWYSDRVDELFEKIGIGGLIDG